MSQQMVDLMETVWKSIDGLCGALTQEQWSLPTECPGWSVQDQVSHLVGSECRILGRPAPAHEPSDTSHVRNEVGQGNEVLVDYRRQFSGADVLAEFREITAERLGVLRGMSEADFAVETPNPLGSGPYTDLLAVRIYDAWVHEQDMRRTLGIPGHLSGAVAEHAYGRTQAAMPFVVGRKVKPDDDTTVVFEITGDAGGTIVLNMDGGRANRMDPAPNSPTVRLTMGLEPFNALGTGRWSAEHALGNGSVAIDGDRALGERIVAEMNFMI
ncbi:hypothetical protein GBAR_LOCUS4255 [Geodia barretti]|uniref:Maleylpyruvate isomerase family mycothiol-dependent enzyme n=1 Tax=Geodia barretti TaxID=519541 RepID=A0AA35R7X6_GEOBA|nr:hypothetical protein GBAR_LOCUS4255 [Geodia barretti]